MSILVLYIYRERERERGNLKRSKPHQDNRVKAEILFCRYTSTVFRKLKKM